ALQLDARVAGRRTAKLTVDGDGSGLIHDRVAVGPQPRAVIGVLVIGGSIPIVEAIESLEDSPASEQKSGRAEIDVPLEVVFRSHWVAAATVPLARSIGPDDGPGLLEATIRKNEFAADGADRVRAAGGSQ